MAIDETYRKHKVFLELSQYAEFYRTLSRTVFAFITMGTKSVWNIDSYLYSSIEGTLESIRDILSEGRINDSFALLRKLYDSVIINVYSNLFLQDHFSLANFTVTQINDWLGGKQRLPEYREMSQYIRQSKKLENINKLVYKDETYKSIRDRCNDHTHYNFFYYVLLNDNEVFLKNRMQHLDALSADVTNIFILHLAYLFTLNAHYMMASDYADSLDMGLAPEEGSQYFVAPFVQDIFDSVIKVRRMDIASEIMRTTEMKLT